VENENTPVIRYAKKERKKTRKKNDKTKVSNARGVTSF